MFNKTIKIEGQDWDFDFKGVFYGDVLKYHVSFYNPELKKDETFRMSKDESGQWKILAQVLPVSIHDNEMAFNDAIEENQ